MHAEKQPWTTAAETNVQDFDQVRAEHAVAVQHSRPGYRETQDLRLCAIGMNISPSKSTVYDICDGHDVC